MYTFNIAIIGFLETAIPLAALLLIRPTSCQLQGFTPALNPDSDQNLVSP